MFAMFQIIAVILYLGLHRLLGEIDRESHLKKKASFDLFSEGPSSRSSHFYRFS